MAVRTFRDRSVRYVAAQILDGVVAGADEVLADAPSRGLKQAIACAPAGLEV